VAREIAEKNMCGRAEVRCGLRGPRGGHDREVMNFTKGGSFTIRAAGAKEDEERGRVSARREGSGAKEATQGEGREVGRRERSRAKERE